MILLEKATVEKNYTTYLAEDTDTEETVLATTKDGDVVLFKKEDAIEKKIHVGDSFFQLATATDGGGDFYITHITSMGASTVQLDKTFAELQENIDNAIMLFEEAGLILTITDATDDAILFSTIFDGSQAFVVFVTESANNWELLPVNVALDYTVRFETEDGTYAISSVKRGQSISAPIPNPESESGGFVGWSDYDGIVTFPYTPEADTVLNAEFLRVRDNIVLNKNGVWFGISTKGNCIKTKDDWAIVGYTRVGNFYMVGKTADSVANSFNRPANAFVYDGETYYYAEDTGYDSKYVSTSGICEQFVSKGNHEENAKALLDHYYMKD